MQKIDKTASMSKHVTASSQVLVQFSFQLRLPRDIRVHTRTTTTEFRQVSTSRVPRVTSLHTTTSAPTNSCCLINLLYFKFDHVLQQRNLWNCLSMKKTDINITSRLIYCGTATLHKKCDSRNKLVCMLQHNFFKIILCLLKLLHLQTHR